jgi:hypothetical protein
VDPTNNRAEGSLRGAVIYRKLSLASHGEQRIERLLSALDNLPSATPLAARVPQRATCRPPAREIPYRHLSDTGD